MANVIADLPAANKEVQCCHPFLAAESRLAGKIMEMCHETRHQVGEPLVLALRVDSISVRGDVIDGEVQQGRYIALSSHFGRQ